MLQFRGVLRHGAEFAFVLFAAALSRPDSAPPVIDPLGVVNAASHRPATLAGGSLAPGARIRISGWRLGPEDEARGTASSGVETLAGVSIEIYPSDGRRAAIPLRVNMREIEAVLPPRLRPGAMFLTVKRDGKTSPPFAISIAERNFGIFSRNGRGWGPGRIENLSQNGEWLDNTRENSSSPGTLARLEGTGLGGGDRQADLRVFVGGKQVDIQSAGPSECCAGVDRIVFVVPPDAPRGCYVPVMVKTGDMPSNAVTMAVHSGGGTCEDPANWMLSAVLDAARRGWIFLSRITVRLDPGLGKLRTYNMDCGFASFRERTVGESLAMPVYMFPPFGSCTTYTGMVHVRRMLALSIMEMLTGRMLDGGTQIQLNRGSGRAVLDRTHGQIQAYAGAVGGHAPLPRMQQGPLFFRPGEYEVSATGGEDFAAFRAPVRVVRPLEWKNMNSIGAIDRAQGVTVHWKRGNPRDLVLIAAMNVDQATGATGACVCLAPREADYFAIPPEALTQIPPLAKDEGFPLNLLILVELPDHPDALIKTRGLDAAFAVATSISMRTVTFQ